jgi:hypothetical protein
MLSVNFVQMFYALAQMVNCIFQNIYSYYHQHIFIVYDEETNKTGSVCIT